MEHFSVTVAYASFSRGGVMGQTIVAMPRTNPDVLVSGQLHLGWSTTGNSLSAWQSAQQLFLHSVAARSL